MLPLSSWRLPWRAERAPPGRERGGTSVPQRRLRRAPGWRPRLTCPLLLSSQVCPRVPLLLGTLVHHTGQDFIHRIWVHGTFGAVSLSTSRGKCHSVCGRLTVNDRSLQRVIHSPQVPEPGDLAPRPRAQPWKPREEGRRVQASCSGGALCLRSAHPQAQQGPPLPQGSALRSGPRVRVLWPLQESRHPGPRGPTPDLGAPERLVHP